MDSYFLKKMKARLSQRHQDLTQGMKIHRDQIGRDVPQDFADAASHKETESLHGHEDLLGEAEIDLIDEALQRIESGGYGICAECQHPILQARLELVPHARFCVPCQGRQETQGKSGGAVS